MSVEILQGDCLEVLRTLAANSVDAVVTDPPYHLISGNAVYDLAKTGSGNARVRRSAKGGGFMGQAWDGGDVAQNPALWAEVLRVAKPGAHLLAFGGTRTFHRMICAIEDAGFEIRDCIMWVYGSGFPKSLDVSKAIDKAAGAEREVVATGKPVKRMIPGADQNGSGSWIKDNGREFTPLVTEPATEAARQWDGWGTALKPAWEPIVVARKPLTGSVAANVQEHGTGAINIDGCRVQVTDDDYAKNCSGDRGHDDNRSRDMEFGMGCGKASDIGRWPANVIHDGSVDVLAHFPNVASGEPAGIKAGGKLNCYSKFAGGIPVTGYGDAGSAARFFYCAKASGDDRESFNNHPTVKPLALMRYLVRLVTPAGGTVLDPFLGSGTTAKAADLEGSHCIGIELNPDYVKLAKQRIRQKSLLC